MPNKTAIVLRVGDLRSSILIQSQTMVPDPVNGAPSSTWATVRTTNAKIADQASVESFLADQFTSEVSHILTVRWTPVPLKAGMRVLYGTRVFNIQTVVDVLERHIRVNLLCLEVDGVIS